MNAPVHLFVTVTHGARYLHSHAPVDVTVRSGVFTPLACVAFQGHDVVGFGRGGVGMAERARPVEALQPSRFSSHRVGDPE